MGSRKSPYLLLVRNNIIRLDCDFIMKPRILFNDKNLSRTDTDLLSLIISLALNNDYCYANNKYLAKYINTSIRTISESLSKLKKYNYIIVKNDNGKRKIYLNNEKIPTKIVDDVADFCSNKVAESCDHNINSKNKIEYNKIKKFKREGIIPEWMKNPDLCKSKPMTEEEQKEFDKQVKELQEEIDKL